VQSHPFAADNTHPMSLAIKCLPQSCARHCIDQSRGVRLIGHNAPQNCHVPFGDCCPHIPHCSLRQVHSSSQTASRSVQLFLHGLQLLCCRMHCQWRGNTKSCAFLLGFHHPAGVGPIHSHRQQPQKIGRNQTCCSRDIFKKPL